MRGEGNYPKYVTLYNVQKQQVRVNDLRSVQYYVHEPQRVERSFEFIEDVSCRTITVPIREHRTSRLISKEGLYESSSNYFAMDEETAEVFAIEEKRLKNAERRALTLSRRINFLRSVSWWTRLKWVFTGVRESS